MPDLDIPKDPTSLARGPPVLGHGEKAPRNERPQRRTAAPGLAGGVGVYWGEWSRSGSFPFPVPPGPFLLTAAGAALGSAETCESVPKCPLSPGARGFFLERPAGSCSLPGVFEAAGQKEVSLSPLALIAAVPHFFRKAGLRCPLPLIPAPAARVLDLRSPGNTSWGDSDSPLRAPFSPETPSRWWQWRWRW